MGALGLLSLFCGMTFLRFARDLIVQETGHRMLKGKGIEIIAADSPTAFVDVTPTATSQRSDEV